MADGQAFGAALVGFGGLATAYLAQNEYEKSRGKVKQFETDIAKLEAQRVAISNPYANVTNLSSSLTNPYDGLSVATQAAKMQTEEADIALANTLDTMRALGQGAGGATALAQAALRSKKGVSATIEQQEVNNEKLRAQGEATLQQAKMAEAQRIQQADVAGRQFMYAEQDKRDLQKLDRTQALMDQERANAAAQQAAMFGALGDTVGNLAGMLG
jgi:hypothetical protein